MFTERRRRSVNIGDVPKGAPLKPKTNRLPLFANQWQGGQEMFCVHRQQAVAIPKPLVRAFPRHPEHPVMAFFMG